MTIHETTDKEFLREVVMKPFDEVGSQEFTRLWNIANRAQELAAMKVLGERGELLTGVLKIVATHLQDVADDPVRIERAQEFARMQIEELFR